MLSVGGRAQPQDWGEGVVLISDLIRLTGMSWVIRFFIFMTCTFDKVALLFGEIRCLSLLGLKGKTKFLFQLLFLHR